LYTVFDNTKEIILKTSYAMTSSLWSYAGMDPAEPYFIDMDDSKRLDHTDAQFVDVIHSDAENFTGISGE
jgi:hypothetical protein